jgi:site-specific DNA-methyltransferase (adenine-specific)
MTDSNIHFSSKSSEWETPQEFFDRLDEEFDFDFDPCATAENAKCIWYCNREVNGLSKRWFNRVFMNPPYGRGIGRWVEKAYRESQQPYCDVVVGLIPSRTDTAWWHDWVMQAAEIRLVRGRLKFGGCSNSAPFPSAVVVWRKGLYLTPVFLTMRAVEKKG